MSITNNYLHKYIIKEGLGLPTGLLERILLDSLVVSNPKTLIRLTDIFVKNNKHSYILSYSFCHKEQAHISCPFGAVPVCGRIPVTSSSPAGASCKAVATPIVTDHVSDVTTRNEVV